MANEATAELYTKQSGINKAKFKTDYEQYLEELATKYGISNEQLNTNLEARGILRSGEAGTARTRLSAAEEAARTSAQSNYDYNIANEDVSLATKLAGLMAGSSTGIGSTPTPPTPTKPAAVAPVATPATVVSYGGGTTQGQLPQAVQLPTGFDMSGFMKPTKPKPTAQKPGNFGLQNYTPFKPATVTIKPPSARNR